MGRRTGGRGFSGGGVRRSAPRSAPAPARPAARRPAAPPARTASTKAAPAPSKPAPPPAKATPTPAPPAPQQASGGSAMGGFMANIASTAAGVAAGRAIDRAIFGGGSQAAAAPVEYEQGGHELPASSYDEGVPAVDDEVCSREILEFQNCLNRTGTDLAACNWNLEILQACQRRAQENHGFADAGSF